MKAHMDPVAVGHTFLEVISADERAPKSLREIKHRCLNPGLYAQHIDRWLNYYDSSQVFDTIDSVLQHDVSKVFDMIDSVSKYDV